MIIKYYKVFYEQSKIDDEYYAVGLDDKLYSYLEDIEMEMGLWYTRINILNFGESYNYTLRSKIHPNCVFLYLNTCPGYSDIFGVGEVRMQEEQDCMKFKKEYEDEYGY